VHDQAAAFALNALDEDESSAFELHLATCPVCEDELERLHFAAAALAFAGELPQPPAQLRLRVLDVGGAVIPLRLRWHGRLLSAAVAAAACVVLAAFLQPFDDVRPTGTVVLGESGKAVLIVRHLGPAPKGKAYEAWIVSRGRIAPAGMLRGSMVALTRPLPRGSTVVVSLEPIAGSRQPTGPVVLKAETA
jgi:hypothetical protein